MLLDPFSHNHKNHNHEKSHYKNHHTSKVGTISNANNQRYIIPVVINTIKHTILEDADGSGRRGQCPHEHQRKNER